MLAERPLVAESGDICAACGRPLDAEGAVRHESAPTPSPSPRRSSAPPKSWLLAEATRQAAAVWASKRRAPRMQEVAGRMGYSRSGLAKALEREGLDWTAIKFESHRLRQGARVDSSRQE